MNAIETDKLTKRFGKKIALDSVSFNVPEGSVFAFLGPNGAGKTTTLKILMGLQPPDSGSSRILGQDSQSLQPEHFQKIGYLSENQHLPDWMTLKRFLAFCRPLYPTWDEKFCEELREQFDLPIDQKLKSFSRGMKGKAALLSSLAYRPSLLVMDEPFTGLDPLVREELVRGMLKLTQQQKWTIIISSHDIDEVERLADWVGFLDQGKLRICEPTVSLQQRLRKVECILPAGTGDISFPASWLLAERNDLVLRFVHEAFKEESTAAELASQLPPGTNISFESVSLREAFIIYAQLYRWNLKETKK